MDRQTVRQLPQGKGSTNNDCIPSTSRQSAKNFSRFSNKQPNKNVTVRSTQNKQQRSREPKYFGQNFRANAISNGNHLNSSINISSKKQNEKQRSKISLQERLVQANCQFVMSFRNDNSVHLNDPDEPIKWDLVEEVILKSYVSSELNCAVCLSYPTAAKITYCGHVFCWACIIGWINVGEKNSNYCPLCFKTVKKSELKSVSVMEKVNFTLNDHLTFTLMKCRKGSTVALPANFKSDQQPLKRLSRNKCQTLDSFAKMFTALPNYVTSLLEREKKELSMQLSEYESENMPEVCFVHDAFVELEKRKSNFEQITSLCEQFSDIFLSQEEQLQNVTDDYTYFYQSDDGQPIYLHSLNVRMLKREFGELKNCPQNISVKIVDLQCESINEEIRRRYSHLRHLPLSCEFKIAEVEFDTTIVSKSTLDEFFAEINNRKKNRQRKEKAQKTRDRRIDIENKRKFYGIVPDPVFHLDNVTDFPEYHADFYDYPNVNTQNNEVPSTSVNNDDSPSTIAGDSGEFQSSFAKMLSVGGSSFDQTLRKKVQSKSSSNLEAGNESDDNETDNLQPTNITLGDFFDVYVKKAKNKKTKKK